MSWFLRRTLVIAIPIIEILLIFWVASVIGWLFTVLLLFAGIVVGIALLRLAGRNVFEFLRNTTGGREVVTVNEATGETTSVFTPGQSATDLDPDQIREATYAVRESGYLVSAGLLFMVPGFLSDVAGAVLALPPVRRALAHRRPVTITPGGASGVVIQGETTQNGPSSYTSYTATETVVVDESGVHVTHWDNEPAGESPVVIRGEILPPKDE